MFRISSLRKLNFGQFKQSSYLYDSWDNHNNIWELIHNQMSNFNIGRAYRTVKSSNANCKNKWSNLLPWKLYHLVLIYRIKPTFKSGLDKFGRWGGYNLGLVDELELKGFAVSLTVNSSHYRFFIPAQFPPGGAYNIWEIDLNRRDISSIDKIEFFDGIR